MQDILTVDKRRPTTIDERYFNLVVYYVVVHEHDLEEEDGRDVNNEHNQRGLEEEDRACITQRRRTIKCDPRGGKWTQS